MRLVEQHTMGVAENATNPSEISLRNILPQKYLSEMSLRIIPYCGGIRCVFSQEADDFARKVPAAVVAIPSAAEAAELPVL